MNQYYGLAYSQLGMADKSTEFLLKIEQDERNASFYFNLAESYAATGQYNLSERYYKQSIGQSRDDNLRDETSFHLALLYLKMKRYDESRAIILEYQKKYPNSAESYRYLGDIYAEQGNDREARIYWQQAIRLDRSQQDVLERLLQ
jgi:tetratricopeptide (TPR) repeat protein